jgi:hypothetical protein
MRRERLADTDRQSVFRSELLRQVLYSVRSERMLATTTRKPLTFGLVDSEGDS